MRTGVLLQKNLVSPRYIPVKERIPDVTRMIILFFRRKIWPIGLRGVTSARVKSRLTSRVSAALRRCLITF